MIDVEKVFDFLVMLLICAAMVAGGVAISARGCS